MAGENFCFCRKTICILHEPMFGGKGDGRGEGGKGGEGGLERRWAKGAW